MSANAKDLSVTLDTQPSIIRNETIISKEQHNNEYQIRTYFFRYSLHLHAATCGIFAAVSGISIAYTETAPAIAKQPVSVSLSNGKTGMVTVEATGKGLTYAWYYRNA